MKETSLGRMAARNLVPQPIMCIKKCCKYFKPRIKYKGSVYTNVNGDFYSRYTQ